MKHHDVVDKTLKTMQQANKWDINYAEQKVLSDYFLCIIKFCKIVNYANPYIYLKIFLMRIYSFKNKPFITQKT